MDAGANVVCIFSLEDQLTICVVQISVLAQCCSQYPLPAGQGSSACRPLQMEVKKKVAHLNLNQTWHNTDLKNIPGCNNNNNLVLYSAQGTQGRCTGGHMSHMPL